MFRSLSKKALQLIVLTLLIINISFNSVLAQELPSSNVTKSQSPNLEQTNRLEIPITSSTEDKRIVIPNNERQPDSRVSSSSADSSQPQDPYEKYYDAIKKFNDELYGEQG